MVSDYARNVQLSVKRLPGEEWGLPILAATVLIRRSRAPRTNYWLCSLLDGVLGWTVVEWSITFRITRRWEVNKTVFYS